MYSLLSQLPKFKRDRPLNFTHYSHSSCAQKVIKTLNCPIFQLLRKSLKRKISKKYWGFDKMGSSKDGSVEEEHKDNSASIDLNDYAIIKEGEAEILMHRENQVFFNKAQVNNRDMSIAVLRTFINKRKQEHEAFLSRKPKGRSKKSEEKSDSPASEDVSVESVAESKTTNGVHDGNAPEAKPEDACCGTTGEPSKNAGGKAPRELKPPTVLEALSASGLRALRYAREVEEIAKVVALDNDKASVEACRRNIKLNGSVACSKVESHLADARVYMLTHPKEFEVVDLDPYGSPSVFLDSAVQSVADGGMLMCTATDMAVLCGGHAEVCYSKYGAIPLKAKYCHEMALRILLASIESHANRYKRHIVPVLSIQMDFYIRVFVRIYSSASAIKETPIKLSYVYQCVGCDSFHLQPLGRAVSKNSNSKKYYPGSGPVVPQECTHCNKRYNMGGPIWSAPIHDQEWVTSILSDVKAMEDRYPAYNRIVAVLTTVSEELPDVPLFLCLHNLCGTLKCTSPSAVILRSAVLNAGYRISGTHASPLGLKTDAPMSVIWDIMRCWVKQHPVKSQSADQPGTVILSKEPELQANFTRAVASLSKAQAKKVARFLPNPERYWGPKVRAGRQITSKHVSLMGEEAIKGSANYEEGG
ncbi:tRNA (guanine(26)-N(2))-dimethyltransferase 2 isoform X2 [Beta vulgaris subsp. vulgaris]|uniref:tRNA (guanine(26)-N(2))-dimethyltransferase 2 isoform X2 n=1 Tax=Beta vulgaris subsp. vulgaris TaxID=3555 RepID=UPI0020367323|nr:tRNA (guanine(26)-N(2))-dimethyltransferase 2 isoform X2 [Beta vulgaris subsp. vulgaris]